MASVTRTAPRQNGVLGPSTRRSDFGAERLQQLVQRFVRTFGLLVTKQTPCGQPVSPSYAHALMVLLERQERGETTSQNDLSRELGIDKSNIARMCSRMEAARHVEQRTAPNDGRSRLLTLTPSGVRVAKRIREASQERFRHVLSAVPRQQRSTLMEALAVLNNAVGTLGQVEAKREKR